MIGLAATVRVWQSGAVGRTIALYAGILAGAATLLDWLDFRYVAREFPLELYLAIVAIGAAAFGAWIAHHLTAKPIRSSPFVRNDAAIHSLGLSAREVELLGVLAAGQSNKEIARRLGISPNTVKTHIASIYGKLGAARRMAAVEQARFLALIP